MRKHWLKLLVILMSVTVLALILPGTLAAGQGGCSGLKDLTITKIAPKADDGTEFVFDVEYWSANHKESTTATVVVNGGTGETTVKVKAGHSNVVVTERVPDGYDVSYGELEHLQKDNMKITVTNTKIEEPEEPKEPEDPEEPDKPKKKKKVKEVEEVEEIVVPEPVEKTEEVVEVVVEVPAITEIPFTK